MEKERNYIASAHVVPGLRCTRESGSYQGMTFSYAANALEPFGLQALHAAMHPQLKIFAAAAKAEFFYAFRHE
jgi:hypothetical protein